MSLDSRRSGGSTGALLGRAVKIVVGPSPSAHFTIIANDAVRDGELTLRARGLLALLRSHAEGFETSSRDIAEQCPEGKAAVQTAMRELEQRGYMTRRRKRDEHGRWEWECVITDVPTMAQESVHGDRGPETVSRSTVARESGHIKKTTGEEQKSRSFDDAFEMCWTHYPRKVSKQAAKRAWLARVRDKSNPVTPDQLLHATMAYAAARRGQDASYTMHGSTFYGPDRRFEDYVDVAVLKPPVKAEKPPEPPPPTSEERAKVADRIRDFKRTTARRPRVSA